MTLALDTTALLGRYLSGPHQNLVIDAMASDDVWCASELLIAEALAAARHICPVETDAHRLEEKLHSDWASFHKIPVDAECLTFASHLSSEHPVGIVNAIHLSAAARLPKPVIFLTFSAAQMAVAASLGLDVHST